MIRRKPKTYTYLAYSSSRPCGCNIYVQLLVPFQSAFCSYSSVWVSQSPKPKCGAYATISHEALLERVLPLFSLFCSLPRQKNNGHGSIYSRTCIRPKSRSPKELVPPIHPIPATSHYSLFRSLSLSGVGAGGKRVMVSFLCFCNRMGDLVRVCSSITVLTSDVMAHRVWDTFFLGFWDSLTRQVILVFQFSAAQKKNRLRRIFGRMSHMAPSQKQVCTLEYTMRKECLFFFNGTCS